MYRLSKEKGITLNSYYSSGKKIEFDLEWKPQIDIAYGISKTLAFYKGNRKFYLQEIMK